MFRRTTMKQKKQRETEIKEFLSNYPQLWYKIDNLYANRLPLQELRNYLAELEQDYHERADR